MFKGIYIDNQQSEEPNRIKKVIFDNFKSKFTNSENFNVMLDNIDFPNLSQEDNDILIGSISNEEIKQVYGVVMGIKVWDQMVLILILLK